MKAKHKGSGMVSVCWTVARAHTPNLPGFRRMCGVLREWLARRLLASADIAHSAQSVHNQKRTSGLPVARLHSRHVLGRVRVRAIGAGAARLDSRAVGRAARARVQSLHDDRYIRKMLNSGWQKLGVEEVPAQKQQLRVYKLQEEHRHWRPFSAKHEIIIDSPEEAERKAVLRHTQQEALRNQMEVPDHQDY